MKTIKIGITFLLMCLCGFLAKSQTIPTAVNFPTPEVSAFNRYIETPVSYYSGVPQISIPLYEIKMKDVTVPITLNYHAGGIRVDEDATWVGLGWNLDFGGQISRKTRGIPDEHYFIPVAIDTPGLMTIKKFNDMPHYVPDNAFHVDANLHARNQEIFEAKYSCPTQKDFMPDEFYYSLLGYSGKFMFSQELKKFVLFPQEDINVSFSRPSSLFNLQLPNGVSVDLGYDGGSSQSQRFNTNILPTRSNWLVKTIRNNYMESINYSYSTEIYDMNKISGEDYCYVNVNEQKNTNIAYLRCKSGLVNNIDFPGGSVSFITSSREDMPTKMLKEIHVFDKNQNLIKKIVFYYSYFIGKDFDVNALGVYTSDDYRFKRLRLDSLCIQGKDNSTPMIYRFDYNTLPQMPSKYSFSLDHWGYFNGINNPSMIPAEAYLYGYDPKSWAGNRSVVPEKVKVFSLKSIVWPTGGKTEYTYENNDCNIQGMPFVPDYLLNVFVDDNRATKEAYISVGGPTRSDFSPTPDYINNITKTRSFRKKITIENRSLLYMGDGWECITDFGNRMTDGQYSIDAQTLIPFAQCNVRFLLEKIDPDGTKNEIKSFNNTQFDAPYKRTNENKSLIYLAPGSYEMSINITYINDNLLNTAYNNQPHSSIFRIKWKELDNNSSTIFTGGLRIKSIQYYDGDLHLVKKKIYDYSNPTDNKSSGKIVSLPLYHQNKIKIGGDIQAPEVWGVGTYRYTYFFSNSILPLNTTGSSYNGYEYVNEYDQDINNPVNSLKTAYNFSFTLPYFLDFYGSSGTEMSKDMQEPEDWTRGKLLSKKLYKGSNLLQEEKYNYYSYSPHTQEGVGEEFVEEINTDLISYQALTSIAYAVNPPDFFNHKVSFDVKTNQYTATDRNIDDINFFYQSDYLISGVVPYFKKYTGFDKPQSKTTSTYDDNGKSIVTTENYYYEKSPALYQLSKTKITTSQADSILQKYSYPLDYAGTEVYDSMVKRHIINPVIEQIATKAGKELSKGKTMYGFRNNKNLIDIDSIQKSIMGNPLETELTYNQYDNYGNPLQATAKNGVVTSYLWGYNALYPVAKIIGADYNTAKSKVNQTILDTTTNDQALRDELNKLRALPNALVTTYTYKQLIGMTSETDPNGRTTYYEYDEMGRLSLVKDKDKNIIKKICYNYAGQPENCQAVLYKSDAVNDYFYSQNCPGGQTPVAYYVQLPVGKYTSTISAADANNQAQQYAQQQANQYGSCQLSAIPIVCNSVASNCDYYIELTNETTGQMYCVSIDRYHGSVVCYVEPGWYHVYISPLNYQPGNCRFKAGCYEYVADNSTAQDLWDIELNSSCNTINISY